MDTSEISYRVADFLKQYAPFQVAESSDLLAMAAHGRVRFFERNEYILWQGSRRRLTPSPRWITTADRSAC